MCGCIDNLLVYPDEIPKKAKNMKKCDFFQRAYCISYVNAFYDSESTQSFPNNVIFHSLASKIGLNLQFRPLKNVSQPAWTPDMS